MDIYGQVGGLSHADKNGRDCSKPCMFLQGTGCRISGGDAACLAMLEKERIAKQEEQRKRCLDRDWTEGDIEAIRTMTVGEAAIATGHSVNEIRYKRFKMGLSGNAPRPWTEAEVALMLGNPDNAEVGKMIGRTKDAVKNKRHKLAKKGVFLV